MFKTVLIITQTVFIHQRRMMHIKVIYISYKSGTSCVLVCVLVGVRVTVIDAFLEVRIKCAKTRPILVATVGSTTVKCELLRWTSVGRMYCRMGVGVGGLQRRCGRYGQEKNSLSLPGRKRTEIKKFKFDLCLCNPSGRTVALGSTQPLTEFSTRGHPWGVKAAGAYG